MITFLLEGWGMGKQLCYNKCISIILQRVSLLSTVNPSWREITGIHIGQEQVSHRLQHLSYFNQGLSQQPTPVPSPHEAPQKELMN